MAAHHDPTRLVAPAGARLTIDLAALAANWQMLADRASGAATAAVVKADAYGIGLEAAARALAEAGCHTFFVALPEEGLRLRAEISDAVIYVLNGLIPGSRDTLIAADLRPVLGSMVEIEEWAAAKAGGAPTGSAIHVDTGMNRLGLTLGETRVLSSRRQLLKTVAPSLVMSHLASADTPDHPMNRKQLAAFRAVRALLPDFPASLANSAGIFLGSDFHFDVVRPGIALYGGAAVPDRINPMRTVVTAEARVVQVRDARHNETVGYGATETLKRPTRIAILAAGYADGYHRLASSADNRPGARVIIRDHEAPILGRVSMDLIAVDVTDVPHVERGDWAELFGPRVAVDEVAAYAGTIGYELLTGLGRRHARHYVGTSADDATAVEEEATAVR